MEQYRSIRTGNKAFFQCVWRHGAAQDFLSAIGWVVVGTCADVVQQQHFPLCVHVCVKVDDVLVLPSDDFLQEALIELIKAKR